MSLDGTLPPPSRIQGDVSQGVPGRLEGFLFRPHMQGASTCEPVSRELDRSAINLECDFHCCLLSARSNAVAFCPQVGGQDSRRISHRARRAYAPRALPCTLRADSSLAAVEARATEEFIDGHYGKGGPGARCRVNPSRAWPGRIRWLRPGPPSPWGCT